MGNVAVAIVKRNVVGAARRVVADFTFSSSYATNGDTITAADIAKLLPEASGGLADITTVDHGQPLTGERAGLDKTNKKLKLFNADGTEATNATDKSAIVIRLGLTYGQVTG